MKIGLLGCGTVGRSMAELLRNHKELQIAKVLLRRPHPELTIPACYDIADILNDRDISVVVEAIGGLHPAYEYIKAALCAGKHVVTANKQLMTAYYGELTALAAEHGTALRCTAAAGGGIPWLCELGEIAKLDSITAVSGIMNGTTNYILSAMTDADVSLEAVLREAQALGYAEADPSADLDGDDVRRKLALSANIAFGVRVSEGEIPTFGIRGITAEDIAAFRRSGLVCKLIGRAERTENAVDAAVLPALFPANAPEAAVGGCMNRMCLRTKHIGSRAFYGEGAGGFPTASNLIRDCLAILSGETRFYTNSYQETAIRGSGKAVFYIRTNSPERFSIKGRLGGGYLTAPTAISDLIAQRDLITFLALIPEEFGGSI